MSIVEASISVPAEHETNVFGQFDQHIKKMERALNITVVNRFKDHRRGDGSEQSQEDF